MSANIGNVALEFIGDVIEAPRDLSRGRITYRFRAGENEERNEST